MKGHHDAFRADFAGDESPAAGRTQPDGQLPIRLGSARCRAIAWSIFWGATNTWGEGIIGIRMYQWENTGHLHPIPFPSNLICPTWPDETLK